MDVLRGRTFKDTVSTLVFWSRQMNKLEPLNVVFILQQLQNPQIFTHSETTMTHLTPITLVNSVKKA